MGSSHLFAVVVVELGVGENDPALTPWCDTYMDS